ncbi:MAG TPA: hypothetical protein PKJ33_01470 [Alphaproteobacteria bacterium]|nr:hypothetical protein [Alphaproteobacteria bacterium]
MNLRYITVDVGSINLNYEYIFKLANLSNKVEIAIPVSSFFLRSNQKWFDWIEGLLNISANIENSPNISLYLEKDSCSAFCIGSINSDLSRWFSLKNKKTGNFVIKRCQINYCFSIKNDKNNEKARNIYPEKIARNIRNKPGQEFIFTYDSENIRREIIAELNQIGAKFSVMSSCYNGFLNKTDWKAPLADYPQGYLNSFNPENIKTSLDELSLIIPDHTIWIGMNRAFNNPKTKESHFINVENTIKKALEWIEKSRTRS